MVGLFLCAAAGIVAADYFAVDPLVPLILLPAIAGLLCWRRSSMGTHLFVACAFFLLHDFHLLDMPGKKLAREFSDEPLPVVATGVIVSDPEAKRNVRDFPASRFHLHLESIETGGKILRENAVVVATWRGEPPEYGDRVSITGEAVNIAPPRNPGQFDYRAYAHRLGIYSEIRMPYPNDGEIMENDLGNPVIAFAIASRKWMQEKLRLDLEDSSEAAGLIQGMVLGQKNETPEEIRELFQRTGTLHLFVVNGLHIGMFSYIAFMFASFLGAGRRLSVVILIPMIFFYALLTGLSAGSVRASIMAAIVLGTQFVDRKPVTLNNLAAAGLGILLWDTNELFMTGFQFSAGVVFAIIVFAARFQRFFMKFGTPDSFLPRSLWSRVQKAVHFCFHHLSQILGVSTAAFIGSLPFTAIYFHMLPLAAVVANLVIVPVAFLILMEGILSILSAVFSNTLAAIFNTVNGMLARIVLWAVHLFAQIPYGHIYVGAPGLHTPPACEITVLHLSAGAAIHIRSSGKDWLIDCGNTVTYQGVVATYLHSRGVNRLDGFIASHGGANYIGASDSVKRDFTPERTDGLPLAAPNTSLEISDHVKIHVLYPPPGLNSRSADDKALVLMAKCEGRRVLIMPGSSLSAERWLLENVHDLGSDIIIRSQHGADIADDLEFINAVHPKAVVCLAPDFPDTAQIDETWADEVVKHHIPLFRQDQTGAVRIALDRDGFSVRAFVGNQTFLSNSR